MTRQTQPNRRQYRLIITRRAGNELMLSQELSGCSLPNVEVLAGRRVAEQLVVGTKEKYQLETYCLLLGSLSPSSEEPGPERHAVMEAVGHENSAPRNALWVSRAEAAKNGTLLAGDHMTVLSSLQDLDRRLAGPKANPFARPGWIEELFGWVRIQIEHLGLSPTGRFEQLNAGPTFSLMRIETNGAAVWFKATGSPNAHELPVALSLSRLFPGHVPTILGVHASWNGWLSLEVPGTSLDDIAECSAWEQTAEDLAELQIASVGKGAEMLACKAKDLRLPRLATLIDPFLAQMSELMAAQEKQPPAPLSDRELSCLGDRLKDACSRLQSLGLPDTLGHLDMNPGNVVVSCERSVFLDWAELYWGHPFFTFEYLVEHLRRRHPGVSWQTRMRSSYGRRWLTVCSASDLSDARSLAPLVAAFAYVVAGVAWRESARLGNQKTAAYLRSMTRRMQREAGLHREEKAPCPS